MSGCSGRFILTCVSANHVLAVEGLSSGSLHHPYRACKAEAERLVLIRERELVLIDYQSDPLAENKTVVIVRIDRHSGWVWLAAREERQPHSTETSRD